MWFPERLLLSSWTASRILIPFARANSQHAEQFVHYLSSKHHTSREIQSFYEQYLRSNKKIRADLAANPSIFFKIQELDKLESCPYTQLPPEDTWDRKCGQILDCLNVLDAITSTVFYPQQTEQEQQSLQDKFRRACARMDNLQHTLEKITHVQTPHSLHGEAIAATR